jgi:fumarate hydratase class II
MNRDKKLLMAFQKYCEDNVMAHFHFSDEDVVDDFLASPEYKELEVTEEMIEEECNRQASQITDLDEAIGWDNAFIQGANFVKQHGTK